ncbi:hypothetical protein [Novosphingobium sp. KA1]|uniref:hypothetical protein n=1 Tax=Novosphingobium sp. (strain KA1) TaxID=164608 RepID=UPI001A8F521C|nr:hypothetical protein [Novosphingobium sp. KA1]QSR15616.1 hypothetical protein CA833_00075 [Novosphingobium sp. KA1]
MTLGLGHLALAGALASCAAGIGGFFYGTHVGAAQEQAARKRADDAAEAVRARLQGQIDASTERSQAAEYTRQASVREIYHESQKVVERPVYRNVCIDADGVGLLGRAADVANGTGVASAAGAPGAAAQGAAQ